MIPCWGKSLLVRIAIGTVVLFALLSCVQTAGASDIEVYPETIKIPFNQPKQPDETVFQSGTITITNHGVNDTKVEIQSDLGTITPNPPIAIPAGQPIEVTIEASSDAGEGPHVLTVRDADGEVTTVTVIIEYKAQIVVSPSTIHFGTRYDPLHRTETRTETVTISEHFGYKAAGSLTIGKIGNEWVTIKGAPPNWIGKGSSAKIEFQISPEEEAINKNEYSWGYRISSSNAGSATIDIDAYILMPPKLGRLYDEELEIKFDKPKGTVSKYDRYIDVRVRNEGDETLYFNSRFTEYPSGITIRIVNPSGSVSGKPSSENIRLHIVTPYDAPEGTYTGRLDIDATDKDGTYDAGHGEVDITIKIKWPVDFNISSTSVYFTASPPSIDFGSIELKEQGYEKKEVNITLTEFYRYKPVRNLRLPKSGEYRNWLKEEIDFAEIPPGESRNITLKIEPGLEAVPKYYLWKYDISASEISAKRMEVKAMVVPINIPEMIEYLKLFRESTLYKSYPSSEVIISNGVEMLEVVERSEIGAEDWKKIPILMKGTLSLLLSLNDAIVFTDEKTYGEAVESLWTAWISTSTIGSNSNLTNWDISGYAKDISAGADKTTEEVLMDEAKMLELRGWNIKKAVEHAMAMDDISGLKEEENVLESALSYQYAATIYGLLDDKEKRIECAYEESLLMDKHDELVSDATDLRIKSDNIVSNSKENDLITIRIVRIGDIYLLLNPYKYDTFSASYGSAERYLEDASKKYKVAGELLMAENTNDDLNKLKGERRYILSLFFIMCILYGVAFIYVINRVIMGTMAYMRDMYEREVGDIMIT